MSKILILIALTSSAGISHEVSLVRVPDGGIQPQAVVDSRGILHLIYFKGDAKGGDIFYVRREAGQAAFSHPIQVNSHPMTAVAIGTIRGAQLALGKGGRLHVVWDGMGSGAASIAGTSPNPNTPHALFYTRLNDTARAFERERNVITFAYGLDGGSSVAADEQGNVYVVWHAPQPGNTNGEAGRAVYVAQSTDEGVTFKKEVPALSTNTGACACCGLRAFADNSGAVYILFRSAMAKTNRDETLLVSPRPGVKFEIAATDPWQVTTCPMSSAAITATRTGALAAWETADQVRYTSVNPRTLKAAESHSPPGSARRKHPVAVENQTGETLLVWTEGTGWGKGGAVAWQVFDSEGKPTEKSGHADGLPVWSFATAIARANGDFEIVY